MKGEHEEAALRHFKKTDPVLYKAAKRHQGAIVSRVSPKRTKDTLFAALASSVVSQQLSLKAADTIWNRLKMAAGGAVTAASITALKEERMREAGLSAAKVKTLKQLAEAVHDGLHLPTLKRMPEEEAIASLTQIWGIGTWTAEMFLIFALGRLDVFSPGDLGLVRSMELLYGIPKNSSKEEYVLIAQKWAPYRSVACLVLWRHRDSV